MNSLKDITLLKKHGKQAYAKVIDKMYTGQGGSPSIKTEYYVSGKRYEGSDVPFNKHLAIGDTFAIIYYPLNPNIERAKINLDK